MLKIAELKLSRCGLKVADIRKNCDCGIAELRLRSNISLESCGIAIAKVLPSSCGIAIAETKKPLLATSIFMRAAGKPVIYYPHNEGSQALLYIIDDVVGESSV